mmetsp:Transcript_19096/g.46109  ORF Transcript_19096/g.46109 Transcript_19096/m.46109 type:complete len:114 (+) Transcript_19096:133-474(+)
MAKKEPEKSEEDEPAAGGKEKQRAKDRLARFGARTCLSGAGFVVKGGSGGGKEAKPEKEKVELPSEHPVVDLWKEGLRSKKRRSVEAEEEESPRKDAEVRGKGGNGVAGTAHR